MEGTNLKKYKYPQHLTDDAQELQDLHNQIMSLIKKRYELSKGVINDELITKLDFLKSPDCLVTENELTATN